MMHGVITFTAVNSASPEMMVIMYFMVIDIGTRVTDLL